VYESVFCVGKEQIFLLLRIRKGSNRMGGSMLQIKNVKLTHKKDYRVLLEDFTLVLNPGDKAVIIGEEGNGKSTLMKWIYAPNLVEAYVEWEGERILGNERLGYLPQELPDMDKEKTLYEYFTEDETFYDRTPKELAELAKEFHVESDFFYRDQRMGNLSGGEKVKAQFIRLLLASPTTLLLDEPSNDIDIETLEWLEQIIIKWEGIVLFISHDETLIERTANTVVHIEQLRRKTICRATVAHIPYRRYVEERLNSFEKQEQLAQNEKREQRIRDEKIRKLEQKLAGKMDNIAKADRDHIGQVMKKKMKAVKSLEKRYEREDEDSCKMPEQEEAIFFKMGVDAQEIPNGKTVLEYSLEKLNTQDEERQLSQNIFLRVRGPEKICIVGNNGCGKTTLLRKIAAELLERKDIHAEYMPQNYEELLDRNMTPVDFLDTTGEKEERTAIRTYLGSLKYTADEMEHSISELSGGQKAKVLLLKLSLSGANVLILDEPTRNFSPLSGPVIRKILREYPGVIISISHDRKYIHEVCDTVYRLTEQGLCKVEK